MDSATPPSPSAAERERANTPLLKQLGPRLFFAGLAFASFSAFSTRRALLRRRSPVVIMPAQARHQFAQSIKQQQQQAGHATMPSPANPPAHASMPPPANAPATHASRPPALQAQGQTTATSATAEAANAQAMAEATAPELHNSGAVLAAEALALATMNVFSWGFVAVGGALWYLDVRGIDDLRRLVRGGLGADGSGRTEQEVEEEMEEWIVSVISRKERKEKERSERRGDKER